MAHFVGRNGSFLVIELVASLVASGSDCQGIQLGGGAAVELRLRLHKGCSVICHELVPGVGVLADDGIDG